MPYLARITQKNPTALLLLVDQSGSMAEPTGWNGQQITKAQAVASAINSLIAELVARSRRDAGYQPFYDIAVLGYSGSQVRSLLPTAGQGGLSSFLTPELLADNPVEIRDAQHIRTLPDMRTVATVVRQKIWVRPAAEWNTPMIGAFTQAYKLLKTWCDNYRDQPCYPPTVIHITDGETTDGTSAAVVKAAEKLKSLYTGDGHVLLLNIHITAAEEGAVLFPGSASELPEDRYARLLFDISSPMPALYHDEIARLAGRDRDAGAAVVPKGMAYNANMIDLVRMMNIGTATSTLLL